MHNRSWAGIAALAVGPARGLAVGLALGFAVILTAALATSTPAVAGWLDVFQTKRLAESVVVPVQSLEGERFNRLEGQMRTLTGQIEELQFQVRQLQEQLRLMQEDADFRLRELEGGSGGSLQPPPQQQSQALPAQSAPSAAVSEPAQSAVEPAQSAVEPAPAVAPTNGNGGAQPLDLSALARSELSSQAPAAQESQGASTSVASLTPTGNPQADYQQGYDLILAGDYVTAERAFRQFVDSYPTDPRAPDAQYWIGESYFARGQYREAADEFLAGYKSFPDSPKGPDTLLKLGLSLAGLGEREAACSTYAAVLKQYPDASNALRQRVVSEQAVANC